MPPTATVVSSQGSPGIVFPVDVTFDASTAENICFRDESDSDDSTDSWNETSCGITREEIKFWALKHIMTNACLTDLLHLLAPSHSNLPLDARTLLQTNRHASEVISEIGEGEFVYFGMKDVLHKFLARHYLYTSKVVNGLSLKFDIDGLPVQKSSNNSF